VHDAHLILTIGVALAVAFVGGIIARRLGLPVIIGYLVAGLVIGPSTPGYHADTETVQVLAELGVAFLMFSLGVEFSLKELLSIRKLALGGGSVQVASSIVLGALIATLLGWTWQSAILFGMIVSLSSSIVAIKMLLLRGEAGTRHGRATAGIAIFQDLALVPLLVLLPLLADTGGNILRGLAQSVGTAVVVLGLVVLLGLRLVPWLLEIVAGTGSRELFMLAVIVIALGTALGTEQAGLSLAVGAFLAGLVVSESDFSHQVLADIIPLREVFATLFFVSIGMLLNVSYLTHHIAVVLIVITAIVLGKFVILAGVTRGFGLPLSSALLVGVFLSQIGEFSFILASEGFRLGMIETGDYNLILAAAAGTMMLTPLVVASAPHGFRAAGRLGSRWAPSPSVFTEGVEQHARHTIVCGYGRLGAELVGALNRRGFYCVVVDSNAAAVRQAVADGIPAMYGDAGNPEVLRHLGIERARALAVAISDPISTETAVVLGRQMNPRLDIIARARSHEQTRHLRELGATEVIQPEFEASLEMIRHVLHTYGLDHRQVSAIVQRRREAYYLPDEDELRE
jgi:monovalent cation:H+ antiporter-2, CPA2 family